MELVESIENLESIYPKANYFIAKNKILEFHKDYSLELNY